MRQLILATHAHFARGINESVELLLGERANVHAVSMFVDGNDDVALAAREAIDACPAGDDLVVCTDLLGGSVNNEFLKIIQCRPRVFLITNMNLPLLLQLLLADDDAPTEQVIRDICESDDTRVKFVNDLLSEGTDVDEEF